MAAPTPCKAGHCLLQFWNFRLVLIHPRESEGNEGCYAPSPFCSLLFSKKGNAHSGPPTQKPEAPGNTARSHCRKASAALALDTDSRSSTKGTEMVSWAFFPSFTGPPSMEASLAQTWGSGRSSPDLGASMSEDSSNLCIPGFHLDSQGHFSQPLCGAFHGGSCCPKNIYNLSIAY